MHLTQNACTRTPAGTISRETGSIGNGLDDRECIGDLDDEEGIDIEDLLNVIEGWGNTCSP